MGKCYRGGDNGPGFSKFPGAGGRATQTTDSDAKSIIVKCQKRSGSLSSPFIMHPKNVIISASLSDPAWQAFQMLQHRRCHDPDISDTGD